MASHDLKSRLQEVKLEQWFVFAALGLSLVAFFFGIGGLADVWWAGDYDIQAGRDSINVVYKSTLWEQTFAFGTGTETAKQIDESCTERELPEQEAANCRTIGWVRAFVFLKFFAVLFALACSAARLVAQHRNGVDAPNSLQKHLLTAAIALKAFASLCAFLAICIAQGVDFGDVAGKVSPAGAGFVLTILSMIFLLWPSMFFEGFVWRQSYWASTTVTEIMGAKTLSPDKGGSPTTPNLPTLVGSAAASKHNAENNVVKPEGEVDPEAASGFELQGASS